MLEDVGSGRKLMGPLFEKLQPQPADCSSKMMNIHEWRFLECCHAGGCRTAVEQACGNDLTDSLIEVKFSVILSLF